MWHSKGFSNNFTYLRTKSVSSYFKFLAAGFVFSGFFVYLCKIEVMETIKVSKEDLKKAFTKWHKEVKESPKDFTSFEECDSKKYAEDCSNYFFELLKDLKYETSI